MEITINNYTFNLDVKTFRAWLESKPKEFNCLKRDPCGCPIATFLYEKGRLVPPASFEEADKRNFWVSVSPEDARIGKPDGLNGRSKAQRVLLPHWARQFIAYWDHGAFDIGRDVMLEILKIVEEDDCEASKA